MVLVIFGVLNRLMLCRWCMKLIVCCCRWVEVLGVCCVMICSFCVLLG